MKTTCEHCIFAIKSKEQTGCKHNRLQKFIELKQATKEPNGFYTINNYCNVCRNIYWTEYIENPNNPNLVLLARDECLIKFDALIDIEKASAGQIKRIINNIRKNKEYLNKIVLFGNINDDNLEKTEKYTTERDVVISLDISRDKFSQTSRYIHRTIANYLVFTSGVGKNLPDFNQLEYEMNDNLTPIIYKNTNYYFCVSTFFYKNHIYYDNPVKTIIDRYTEYGKSKS